MSEIHLDRRLGGRAGRTLLINSPGVSASASSFRALAPRNRPWGASLVVLAMAAASPVSAANFVVSTEQQLRDAIDDANSNADATDTITLDNDIVISDTTAFPTLNNPVTIDTGPFTLSGADTVGVTPGTSLSFGGGNLTIIGDVEAGDAAADVGNVAGGVGFSGNGTTVTVTSGSTVTGGDGGGHPAATAGGSGGDGLSLIGSGTLINNGTITGGAGGISAGGTDGSGGAGAVLNGGVDHVNNGIIRGGVGSGGNPIGAIGQRGLELSNATLVNNGTIEGGAIGEAVSGNMNADGVYLSNSIIINNSSGAITGGSGTVAGQQGANGVTSQSGTSTIINQGTISGGNSGPGGGISTPAIIAANTSVQLTVVNSGTINSGIGADTSDEDAIRFTGNARGIVELQAGSIINGNVTARLADTDDVLRLGGDEDDDFDVSDIGATEQYRNFNIFEKTGLSTWTITGQGTNQAAPWDIYAGRC
jgi:fibronectin-binding autotransporter adhesin